MTKKFLAYLALILVFFSQPVFAQSVEEKNKDQKKEEKIPGGNWGINIWGLSYHPDDDSRYNDKNWGFGVRRYTQLEWKWFGNKENNNRIFFQVDALKNSYDALLLPVSIGTEYTFKTYR